MRHAILPDSPEAILPWHREFVVFIVKKKMSNSKTIIKQSSLLRSSGLVAFMTFISRILGLLRDAVIGVYFGAGAGADAFWVAFKIPNFLRRLFAEGSFSMAFVPVLAEYQEQKEISDLRDFIHHMATALGTALLLMSVLAMLAAPWIIDVFAPGFGHGTPRHDLATQLLRVTFPYILFIALTAFSGSILNSFGRFGVPAFTPVLLNVSLIVCAIFLAPHLAHPIMALAWGVFIGGVLQLLFQLPFLWGLRLVPKISWCVGDPGVKKVLKLMIPTLIGSSVSQINLLFDTIFASFLQVGSVSWLYYSNRLTQFPLGVFAIAISTVVLPHLSRKHVDNNSQAYACALNWGIRMVLLIGVPAAVGLGLLAGPLLATLFQYGHFSAHDVWMSRESLIAFSFGVTAFMLVKVLVSGFYAKQNTKTPVKIAIFAMLANIILSFILMWPFAHAGLALATSLSAWLNVVLLWWGLKRRDICQKQSGWGWFWLRLLIAVLLMSAYLWFFQGSMQQWLDWSLLMRVLHLLMVVAIAMIIYIGTLFLLGLRMQDLRYQE